MEVPLQPSGTLGLTRWPLEALDACALDADAAAAQLTSAMAAGEAGAIQAFYESYFDLLYGEAARATGRDESFCLDVVQDAVLRVVRSVRQVKTKQQLIAWLRLVVRTTAYDLLRAQVRRQKHERVAAQLASESSDGPTISTDDAERLAWLGEQIAAFDPQLVQMIELRYMQRWRLSEIGRRLGLSVGAVDGRLRRALQQLRDSAKEHFDE